MRDLMLALLTCSVAMSAIMLIQLAISPLISKRCSARSRYYAWLVVVIGLLIPFRPSFNNAIVEIAIPAEPVNAAPVLNYVAIDAGFADNYGTVDAGTVIGNSGMAYATRIPEVNRPISYWEIAGIVWAAGVGLLLAYQVFRHIRFVHTVKRWSIATTSGPAYDLLQTLIEEMGLKRPVSLFHCRILLPHLNFEPGELRYILLHELVHLKRRDLLCRIMTMIATAVHWFNPIVHLTGRAIDLLCEMSCDEEIVQETDADGRLRYSETIIGVIRYQTRMQTPFSTSFYGGENGMKQRILSIMDRGRKRVGAALVLAALILSAGTGFALSTTVAAAPRALSVGPYSIYAALANHEAPGSMHTYGPPLTGHISMGEAINIAEAAIFRFHEHISPTSQGGMLGIASTTAGLIQKEPEGQEAGFEGSLEYSFWEVTMRSPLETQYTEFLIHAATGTVWRVEFHGVSFMKTDKISLEKGIAGLISDLGLQSFEYSEDSIVTLGDLEEYPREYTHSYALSPGDDVYGVARMYVEPYIWADGRLIEDMTAVTIELYLTTESGS